MFDNSDNFYTRVVGQLVREGAIKTDQSILVVCGGLHDKEVLHGLGFKKVTISNLDTRMKGDEYKPFEWSFQDAEDLKFPDKSFDICIVHSGLHHCFSPHRALIEMYRVARRGVLLFEPYDNLVTRLGQKLNIGQEYEHAAVFYNDCVFGGVKNTAIPNFVYRWTRRDIEKTIACYDPSAPALCRYIHGFRIPWAQLKGRSNKLYFAAVVLALPFIKALGLLFPAQSNCFAAFIHKPVPPDRLHPWLQLDEKSQLALNKSWLEQRYRR